MTGVWGFCAPVSRDSAHFLSYPATRISKILKSIAYTIPCKQKHRLADEEYHDLWKVRVAFPISVNPKILLICYWNFTARKPKSFMTNGQYIKWKWFGILQAWHNQQIKSNSVVCMINQTRKGLSRYVQRHKTKVDKYSGLVYLVGQNVVYIRKHNHVSKTYIT